MALRAFLCHLSGLILIVFLAGSSLKTVVIDVKLLLVEIAGAEKRIGTVLLQCQTDGIPWYGKMTVVFFNTNIFTHFNLLLILSLSPLTLCHSTS